MIETEKKERGRPIMLIMCVYANIFERGARGRMDKVLE